MNPFFYFRTGNNVGDKEKHKVDMWMPIYIGDYLADTMHLSAANHGAYFLLMLHYWKTGPIPDNDAVLATITRLGDAWSNASSIIRAFFKHQDGMLFHGRIDDEKIKARDNSNKNQEKARAAAAKRWAKDAPSNAPSIPQALLGECPSPSPSPVKEKSKAVGKSATGSRLPADWYPSEEEIVFCKKERPDLRASEVAARFYDYWIAVPGTKGRKTDWPATWRNWVRKEMRLSESQKPNDNMRDII